MHSDVAMW